MDRGRIAPSYYCTTCMCLYFASPLSHRSILVGVLAVWGRSPSRSRDPLTSNPLLWQQTAYLHLHYRKYCRLEVRPHKRAMVAWLLRPHAYCFQKGEGVRATLALCRRKASINRFQLYWSTYVVCQCTKQPDILVAM